MIDCAVVGASGYAGAELVAWLALHPEVRLRALQADSSAGERWEDLHPGKRHLFSGPIARFDPQALHGLDVVFLAQPHGVSARSARELFGQVGHIIDLGGDLRLADAATYRKWYGLEHPAPELLGRAAYGLPELFGGALKGASLVACAGCYATVSQLAAAPALLAFPEVPARPVVHAASGTTGAGRRADLDLSFSEVQGSIKAYKVGKHQHVPEIRQGLSRHAGRDVSVTFVPHLVPMARGIFASVVLENPAGRTQEQVLEAYLETYAGSPFVRVLDPRLRLPRTADVERTNFCDLAPVVDEDAAALVVLAVIDNLGKGAAGQAVQVMNLACGLGETLGLLPAGAAS